MLIVGIVLLVLRWRWRSVRLLVRGRGRYVRLLLLVRGVVLRGRVIGSRWRRGGGHRLRNKSLQIKQRNVVESSESIIWPKVLRTDACPPRLPLSRRAL